MAKPTRSGTSLDVEFLSIRCRLLELASAFDRIDRGCGPDCQSAGALSDDPRTKQIRRSLEILLGDSPDRAEQVQRTFSLEPEGRGG